MGSRLNPYIGFKDDARQAMEFYQGVFGGDLDINTFGEFGDQDNPNLVMHATLETPAGFTLMASDTPPGMEHQAGSAISVSLSGDDEGELRGYWDALSDGGQVTMPLEKQMWGDVFGMVADKYGVAWMVNIAPPE
jgi:PhnB protein